MSKILLPNQNLFPHWDYDKLIETYRISQEIIEQLSPEAVNELFNATDGKGYEDILDTIVEETYNAIYGQNQRNAIQSSSLGYLDKLSDSFEESLRCSNLNYFITSVLPEFELNAHHILWGELIQKYKYLGVLAARGHGKSFYYSNAYPIWQLYRYKPLNTSSAEQSKRKGYLFSFSITQAVDLLSVLKDTIEDTDILRDRLYSKNSWSKTEIGCKNKTNLKVKGFGSSVRGAHPGWIVVDDGLKENVIYSQSQREKSTSYFHAVIMNMIVPGGPVTVVGTPMHNLDLYGDLKTKENWHVFEFPAIFPDGSILWPNMFSYSDLMEKRKSQGNLIFSRELLCRPITSDSTIFPIEILNTALYRMDEYTLVENRESFKVKFNKVVVGCDFALSSSTGADYLCYTVFGIDDMEKMWLLYVYHRKGVSYAEQIAKLKQINANFRPDIMVMENNVMQQIFVEGSLKENLPVMGHTTTSKKNDLREGLPGLAIMFERGTFKIPTGNQQSKDFADTAILQFSSIAFTEKGLMGIDEHDDIPLSMWLATIGAKNLSAGQFRYDFM